MQSENPSFKIEWICQKIFGYLENQSERDRENCVEKIFQTIKYRQVFTFSSILVVWLCNKMFSTRLNIPKIQILNNNFVWWGVGGGDMCKCCITCIFVRFRQFRLSKLLLHFRFVTYYDDVCMQRQWTAKRMNNNVNVLSKFYMCGGMILHVFSWLIWVLCLHMNRFHCFSMSC